MELDELKDQLKNKLSTDHTIRSQSDIALLLTKKTNSIIAKLKRNLWIEIISAIVFILSFGFIGVSSQDDSLRIYFSVFSILGLAFLYLLFYLLRKTKQLSLSSLPVKSNLQLIVNIIREFTKRYFQFTMALIPICFIFAFLLGYPEPVRIPSLDKVANEIFSEKWKIISFLLAYMVLLSVGIYYFTKWYLRKQYGKYVEQLQVCIEELGEE